MNTGMTLYAVFLSYETLIYCKLGIPEGQYTTLDFIKDIINEKKTPQYHDLGNNSMGDSGI